MDPVQAFLQANALTPPAFAPSSRYYGLPTAQFTVPDGRTVVFVTRRFLPPTENFAVLQTHIVVAGDRLDNLAFLHAGGRERVLDGADDDVAQPGIAPPGAAGHAETPQAARSGVVGHIED